MRHLKDNYWNDKQYDYTIGSQDKSELIIKDNTNAYFVDDIFTIKKPRVKQISMVWLKRIKYSRWPNRSFRWRNAQLMKDPIVREQLGFESGSDKILKDIQKDETTDDMIKGKLLKDTWVPFTLFMTDFKRNRLWPPALEPENYPRLLCFINIISLLWYKMYYDMMDMGGEVDKQPWSIFIIIREMLVNNQISDDMLKQYLSLNELNNTSNNYILKLFR